MTTIAIDRYGTIAADGLVTCHGDIVGRNEEKLRLRHGRIYAMTGLGPMFEPLIKWHHAGADPDKLPKLYDDDASWILIVVIRPGVVTKYSSTCPYPEDRGPPVAFGAGLDHAKGAMLHGATAEEAVRLVAASCTHTGGRIVSYNIAEVLGLKGGLASVDKPTDDRHEGEDMSTVLASRAAAACAEQLAGVAAQMADLVGEAPAGAPEAPQEPSAGSALPEDLEKVVALLEQNLDFRDVATLLIRPLLARWPRIRAGRPQAVLSAIAEKLGYAAYSACELIFAREHLLGGKHEYCPDHREAYNSIGRFKSYQVRAKKGEPKAAALLERVAEELKKLEHARKAA